MSILLKRSLIICSITALCFNFTTSIYGTSTLAYADDNKSERETIDASMQQYKVLDDQVISINSEIAQFDVEISNINTIISDTSNQINETENQITSTENALTQAQNQLEEKEASLAKRLRAMQKSDMTNSLLSYLLTADNISEFFTRIKSARKVITFDKDLITEINNTRDDLSNNMTLLSNKKVELNNLKVQNEESLKSLNSKKSEREAKINELNSQKQNILAIVEENENKLIANSVSTINNSSSKAELENAVATLNALLPQLNSDKVINAANESISAGNSKIEEIKKAEQAAATPSRGETSTSNDGMSVDLGSGKATLTMQSTAYTGGTFTATGSRPVRNPGGISTIAVDPSVIPLGSKVYVDGYGLAIAADTGGAIKGNIIDLYMNSEAECISWGRRSVTVTILAGPMEW